MASENKGIDNPDGESSHLHSPFYPGDITDGREPGNWKTRYSDNQAKREIRKESIFLILLLIICFAMVILILCNVFQRPFGFSESQSLLFNQYLGILSAGIIGGTLYALKWLIHTVGHGVWNEDRKLWRYITPFTSGVLSTFVMLIISSGLFGLFSTSLIENTPMIFSLAFLTGYFSDQMVSRLQVLFENIFGRVENNKKSLR